MNRRVAIIGGIVVIAVAAAIVAIVVATGGSSSDASTSDGTSGSSSSAKSSSTTTTTSSGSSSGTMDLGSSSGSSSNGTVSTITSDPTTATYVLAAFAVGDWGSTPTKDSCCDKDDPYTNYDIVAEEVVAEIMDQQVKAGTVKPGVIIGHGDNFYWDGIMGSQDRDTRFQEVFEDRFAGSNMIDIPWVNVMGNHDYGGSGYICSDSSGNGAKCSSTSDMLTALKEKYSLQSEYVSSNSKRWNLGHYYKYSLNDSTTGISIDIFNVDGNDASSHGMNEICCQCYGYAEGDDDKCDNVSSGDDMCCGGSTDMYESCITALTDWAEESRTQLASDLKSSTATWKIINNHYSAYSHQSTTAMETWFKLLKGAGAQLYMAGHTHGEKHDYSSYLGTHFIENGAGGGIYRTSASGIPSAAADYVSNVWTYDGTEYGFFSVTASKEWAKVQYHTADSSWSYGSGITKTTIGGVATKHCYYVPVDGTEGKLCDSTSSS